MPLPTSPFQILPSDYQYSSQSATSCYLECPRRYLYQYRLYGTGIVPKYSSVPLLAGRCLHKAVENIAGQFLAIPNVDANGERLKNAKLWIDIDKAVAVAQESYREEIRKRPLSAVHSQDDELEQQFVIQEQLALVEAMVRIWYLKEWPKIIEYYDILAVEQEITFQLGPVTYQSKPDLILLHKKNSDVLGYSLKSVKMGGDRLEKSYKVQLQAATEPYAISVWLKELSESIGSAKELLSNDNPSLPSVSFMSRGLGTVGKFLEKYSNLPTRASATRFCYVIKGDRKEDKKGSGRYRTDNPFIYGLRKFTPSGIEYAWTWWTINPENKSGYGRLGKGWEQFPIWQDAEVGGVKGWIDKIVREDGIVADIGEGNVLDKYILSQPDVYSNERQIQDRILETELKEYEIRNKLENISHNSIHLSEFTKNTGSCFFPSYCDYLSICPNGNDFYKQHIADNPLDPEFNAFERRVSHHEPERLVIEALAEEKKEKEEGEGLENVD